MDPLDNQYAPALYVFICPICNRRSGDRNGTLALSDGWNQECMANAILCVELTGAPVPDILPLSHPPAKKTS